MVVSTLSFGSIIGPDLLVLLTTSEVCPLVPSTRTTFVNLKADTPLTIVLSTL